MSVGEIVKVSALTNLAKLLPMFVNLIVIEYLSRILLLQPDLRNIGKKAIRFMGIVTLVFFPLDIAIDCISYRSTFSFVLTGLYTGVYVGSVIFCLVKNRKHHKWLGVFSIIPLVGISDSFFGIWNVPLKLMGLNEEQGDVYQIITLFLMLAVFTILKKRKPSFFAHLEEDIEERTLSLAEEAGIWLVGIWLLLFDVYTSVRPEESAFLYYIIISNFMVAVVILILILDSNYRRYYYLQNLNLQKVLISTMADLVENRDENTGGHIQRTARYVEIIARRLRAEGKYTDILTDEYIKNMVVAAPLHDVGKINIPDAILNKPGRLTADEFEIMKKHTTAGAAIIEKVIEEAGRIKYLEVAEEMAEFHHEKLDGTGYPHGTSGAEIPLCARIMAVSDVFDALVSKRCYKEPMSLDEAFGIITDESGTHFDPDVVTAFLLARDAVETVLKQH